VHTTYKAFLVAAVCLSVSACESLETFNSAKKGETTVHSDGSGADIGMSYGEITREMSNGSVQVYGFDQPAAQTMSGGFDGGVIANDPNVTVYPIGDIPSYGAEVVAAAPAPALMPPSAHTNPMNSPFGGPLQSPLDAPVEIDSSYRPDRVEIDSSFAPTPLQPAPASPAPVSYSEGERSRIYFGHGSSRVNNAGNDVIRHVAGTTTGPLNVEGHASTTTEVDDPVKQRIINLKMSMDRAYEVSESLIKQGVPADRIVTKAYGDTQPSAFVPGFSQEAANRRVEIVETTSRAPMPVASAPVYAPAPVVVPPSELAAPEAPIPDFARY